MYSIPEQSHGSNQGTGVRGQRLSYQGRHLDSQLGKGAKNVQAKSADSLGY